MKRFHLLCGAIFPVYDKIMGSSGIQSVKIARAVLTDGRALVGLNLSPSDVPSVKSEGPAVADIIALLDGGGIIELDNGWRLTRARLAGDDIVELILNGVPANRTELERYGLSEEIVQFKRRWFVARNDAVSVLPELLAKRRPIRDAAAQTADIEPL